VEAGASVSRRPRFLFLLFRWCLLSAHCWHTTQALEFHSSLQHALSKCSLLPTWCFLLASCFEAFEMVPCPLLAQSGHGLVRCTCPLSGVKWTSLPHRKMSANPDATYSFVPICYAATTDGSVLASGQQHAPARFHQSYCWIGAHVPAFGAGAAKRTNKTNCCAHAIYGN
jgi:hypothetical protein